MAAAAIPCLPCLALLLSGQTLWFRDWSLYFLPMKALLADLWRAGELPLWDPFVRNGMPFLANPQSGVLYPPSLLLVVFDVDPGLTLFLLLHVAAAGAGFHLLLREARLPAPAALLGALAFASGGYVASLANVLNNLQAVAWLPWTMLFALRTVRRGDRASWLGLVAATALALLGGELQLAAIGLAVAAALALVEGEPGGGWSARRASRGGTLVLLAVVAAAGLTAFQLLPTAELLGRSVRSAGLPFELATEDSLDPASLFGVAFPRPAMPGDAARGATVAHELPWLLSTYAGLTVVWLAALGCTGRRRRWAAFWGMLAVAGMVLALGRHSPVFRLAFELLPPLRAVRYPEKFLLLTALAVPALAAAGLERVLAARISWRAAGAGAAVLCLAAAGSLVWMDGPDRPAAHVAVAWAVAVALPTAAVLALAGTGRLQPARAAGILCALAAADLLAGAWAVNPGVPWRFYRQPWAAAVLEREGADRDAARVRSTPLQADMEQVAVVTRARLFSNHYLFHQSLAPNLGQLHGWMQQDGLAGIETSGTADLIDALVASPAGDGSDARRRMRLLRLQSVGWVVTSFPLPAEDVRPVATHPELPVAVVRVRDPLPRAYLVQEWEVARTPREALERALAPGFPAHARVVLDREPERAGPAAAAVGAVAGPRVVRARWDASSLGVEVESPTPAVLVVTDTWYPGWDATVDGAPAELLRANGYGRAVAVPAGRHRVEMSYRPASFLAGVALSVATAVVVTLALAWGRRSRDGGSRPRAGPTTGEPVGAPAPQHVEVGA